MNPRRLVILSQTYPPDPAAAGQYLHEVGSAMATRGWSVHVVTADRGYDDRSSRFAARETLDCVEVTRVPSWSLGKASVRARLLTAVAFLARARAAMPRLTAADRVLVATSPPIAPAAAPRGPAPVIYWAMDINPDQAVALGVAGEHSLSTRLYESLHRWMLGRADRVVTLDEAMADRLRRKRGGLDLHVVPPWPLSWVREDLAGAASLRDAQGWRDKFVVMHAGNHTRSSPLDTLLHAAKTLLDRDNVRFVLVGGGGDKPRLAEFVATHGLTNVELIPYRRREELSAWLSAADVHVASTHDGLVGVCHPSKPYSALAARRPVIFLGPVASPVAQLLKSQNCGWTAPHGDVAGLSERITQLATMATSERDALRRRCGDATDRASHGGGVTRLCELIEGALKS
jgi:glycosyltransferase involved in cell wall biosynthesis